MRWIWTRFLVIAGVSICAVVYLSLGYRFDWPTMFYVLGATVVANAIREAAE